MTPDEPILHNGIPTLSFAQVDRLNRFTKGTAFRLFKAGREALAEGQDYYYLPAAEHQEQIAGLKSSGQIYPTTVNVVLLTQTGYGKLRQRQA